METPDNVLILESDESCFINGDGDLVIENADGPYKLFPAHLFYMDKSDPEKKIHLIFDYDNGTWEIYYMLEHWTYWIDEDLDLIIVDGDGDCVDLLEDGDYRINEQEGVVYYYEEITDSDLGITYWAEIQEELALYGDDEDDDEFGLFGDMPYDERPDDEGWRRGE